MANLANPMELTLVYERPSLLFFFFQVRYLFLDEIFVQ